jgi:hypothetical protein
VLEVSGNLLATVRESNADFRFNQTWIFGLLTNAALTKDDFLFGA